MKKQVALILKKEMRRLEKEAHDYLGVFDGSCDLQRAEVLRAMHKIRFELLRNGIKIKTRRKMF